MLGQSKTAHQAEIDAACEVIDFYRFNVEFMTRIYEEQPVSSQGVWNRMEYRPLEGFVFAVSPFNFTAIGANLPASAALMGNTVVWKPAGTAAYSAHFLMELLQEAGLPPGVINLVYGRGATIGDAALASEPRRRPLHRLDRGLQLDVEHDRLERRQLPQLPADRRRDGRQGLHRRPPLGRTWTRSRPRSCAAPFEYQGQKCSAASRVYAPANLWPELRERLADQVAQIKMGDVADFENFMGAVIDAKSLKTQREAIEEARAHKQTEVLVGGGVNDEEGFFVEPTVIETKDPGLPPAPRRALRARSSPRTSIRRASGATRSSSSTGPRPMGLRAPSSRTTETPCSRQRTRFGTRPGTST